MYDPNVTKDERKKFEEGLKRAHAALKNLDSKSDDYKKLQRAINAFGRSVWTTASQLSLLQPETEVWLRQHQESGTAIRVSGERAECLLRLAESCSVFG